MRRLFTMSNRPEFTFHFVRRSPRPVSSIAPGPSTPGTEENRLTPRVKAPNSTRTKMTDAKNNVTAFCANREVTLRETERKLEQVIREKEEVRQRLNQSLLQETRLMATNEQLQKILNQVEDRLARCEANYLESQADYEEACKALELAESIRAQLCGTFEEIKSTLVDGVRRRVKTEAEEEIQRATRRFQESEKRNEESTLEWQRRSNDWDKAEQSYRESVKQLTNDRELLQQQLSQITASLSILVQDKNEYKNKWEGALEELNQMKESYQEELESKVGNTINELQTERNILTTLRKKLAEKEEQSTQLSGQIQQLNEQLRECHQRMELMERASSELNAQLQVRDSRISSLERQCQEILEERNQFAETASRTQEQLTTVTNQYESASLACAEARETAKDLTKEKLSLQHELLNVSHQLEKCREDVNRVQAENSRLELELRSANDQLESRSKALSTSQLLINEEERKNKDLSSRFSDLEADRAKRATILAELEAENKKLQQRLEEQLTALEELRSDLQTEKKALERADKEVIDIRESLVEKERLLIEKGLEVEYKNKCIDELTEANKKLTQEMSEVREETGARFNLQLETSVRENQSRIQELVIKLDRQKEQEKKAVAKLKYELQLARESQERAESNATEAEAAASDLRHRLDEALKEEKAYKQKLTDLEKSTNAVDNVSTNLSATRSDDRPQLHEVTTDEDLPAPKKSVTFKDPNKELLAKFHHMEAKAADEMVRTSSKKGAASESTAPIQSQTKDTATKRGKRRLHSDKPPAQPSLIEASPVLKAGPPRSYGRTRATAYPIGSKSESSVRSSLSSLDDKEFK